MSMKKLLKIFHSVILSIFKDQRVSANDIVCREIEIPSKISPSSFNCPYSVDKPCWSAEINTYFVSPLLADSELFCYGSS